MYCRNCGHKLNNQYCQNCGLKSTFPKEYFEPQNKKGKFYQKTWCVILTLIFFAPLGIVLLWSYKTRWNFAFRVGITAVALIGFFNFYNSFFNLASPDSTLDATQATTQKIARGTYVEITDAKIKETTQATTTETTSYRSYLESILLITCDTMSKPNSFGGVDFDIDVINTSDTAIKYIRFQILVSNRVGDPISSDFDFDLDPYFTLEMVGPIYPGEAGGLGEYWECPFYNSTAAQWGINKLEIEYITGEKVELSSSDVRLIS